MTPYYQSPDGSIVVYHARWEDVLAAGLIVPREVALVHADPPYGVSACTDRTTSGRPDGTRAVDARRKVGTKTLAAGARYRAYAPVFGDDKPFDPSPLVALARPSVIWGGNNFASKLPDSRGWIVWDKTEEFEPNDSADVELAWTNLPGAERCFGHWWRGALRKTEKDERHLHPTQKPIALCSWVYQRARLKPGDLVLVPYMGSGPDLAACVAAGLRCIACEVSEEYCRVAVGARLRAAPVADAPGPLFAARAS